MNRIYLDLVLQLMNRVCFLIHISRFCVIITTVDTKNAALMWCLYNRKKILLNWEKSEQREIHGLLKVGVTNTDT